MSSAQTPLALRLPLHGLHWIEASAGTGKTFTLSFLVLRCLLERGLSLPEILIVTFTNTATDDLKIKVRKDIRNALACLTLLEHNPQQALQDSKQTLFIDLLQRCRATVSDVQLRQRLKNALLDYDRASIYSIHGFCSRMLDEYALLLDEMLQGDTLLTNTSPLERHIALAIWRQLSMDEQWNRALFDLWDSPSALARQVSALLRAERLLPEVENPIDSSAAKQGLLEAHQQLRQSYINSVIEAKAFIQHAIASGWMHKSNFTAAIANASFEKLAVWFVRDDTYSFDDPGMQRLSIDYLMKMAGKNKANIIEMDLFIRLQQWQSAYSLWLDHVKQQKVMCLHHVQALAKHYRQKRLAQQKEKTYDDLIEKLFLAMHASGSDALIDAMREAYPVAMVDEFQDTDTKQWQIFSRLYLDKAISPEAAENHRALYLIGDPKQAIYGFRGGDVHAYLSAKKTITQQFELAQNFRARPSLINAINHCFTQQENPFMENAISFTPVTPGGTVDENDFLWRQQPAAAMLIAVLPDEKSTKEKNTEEKTKPIAKYKARELAAAACAEKISELLYQAKHAQIKIRKSDEQSEGFSTLKPEHMAVLVNTHEEARCMQLALLKHGVASITAAQQNIFETQQAQEIRLLLEALLHPQDIRRWRGALSSQLLGYSPSQLMLLDYDNDALQVSTLQRIQALERWRQAGVLAMLQTFVAAASAPLLALNDGERRLGNYLQLAEILQDASRNFLGQDELYRWFCQQIANPPYDADQYVLRLDSDQPRVKIFTIHKSKGLEFPLVFLPFLSLSRGLPKASGLSLVQYQSASERISHAMLQHEKSNAAEQQAKALMMQERDAEQVRLLYVAMTRAQHYLWLCCGHVKEATSTAFARVLGMDANMQSQAQYLEHLTRLGFSNNNIQCEALADISQKSIEKHTVQQPAFTATTPSQALNHDWRVHSFSSLNDQLDPAAYQEMPALKEADAFGGKQFGNALHEALENIDREAWKAIGQMEAIGDEQMQLIERVLQNHGFIDEDVAPASAVLSKLIRHTLQIMLPEGIALCNISDNQCRKEMEFYFSLSDLPSQDFWQLLVAHKVLLNTPAANMKTLPGLMTGKIDLVYQHANRFYILDYKSNRLSAYDHAHCDAAMHHHHYYLQALIYTLALHRWCRFQLGDAYRYEQHMGGVRYLFCRGLNADAEGDQSGVMAFRFEAALIEAIDAQLSVRKQTAV
jgi:exodeoxyribonuclease V beta subunit